jgi:two-component system, LuxR family, response regulator FixJ
MNGGKLAVLDANSQRRAAICYCLSQLPIHVEPFESAAEIPRDWNNSGPILVHDEAHAILHMTEMMEDIGDWLPIVAYAETISIPRVVQAIKEGAIDYLAWPFVPSAISDLFDRVAVDVDHLSEKWMRTHIARAQVSKLSCRERQVLQGMVDGLSNRGIANCLDISARTVEVHRANLLKKLRANHTSEAIRMAWEAGLGV